MVEMEPAKLLRIFIGELDQLHGRPLYEVIVQAAQRAGLAGATVLRGIESYGASSKLHTAKILRLAENLPLVIEIVDSEQKIAPFMETLDALLNDSGRGGMVTLEAVQAIRHLPRGQG